MEIKRKLASIRRIDRIEPIPGADAIECAYVGGWPVVIRKNEYKVGDLAIYIEIDSVIPHVLAPFLSKGKEPRVYNGIKGERLRTLKLRGQVSQGLLLPVDWQDNQPFITSNFLEDGTGTMLFVHEGDDVTEALGIQKWEAPIPANLAGQVKGSFPSFIPKTDQERCISGGTLIETNQGFLKIEDIVREKMDVAVSSFNHETSSIEMKRVTDWSTMSRRDCWVKITLKSGREIICTNNHKIWCDDISAYRNAESVQVGQKVITKTEH